jgi:hyperosmotically inducible periplasmic protein
MYLNRNAGSSTEKGEAAMTNGRYFVLSMTCLAVLSGLWACRPRDDVRARDDAARPEAGVQPGPGVTTGDAWITTRVQARYFAEPDVRGRAVGVTTEDGVVTLRGRVESEHERQQAIRIAREIDGVRDVRDELSVAGEAPAATTGDRAPAAPDARPAEPGRERDEPAIGERVSSAWITTKIRAQYFTDPDVRGREIDVTASNGIVTLTGQVESERARQQALAIARETEGVVRVEDRLQLVPEAPDRTPADREPIDREPIDREPAERQPVDREPIDREADRELPAPAEPERTPGEAATPAAVSDADLVTRVQSRLHQEEDLRGHQLEVRAENGVVTLTGAVRSERLRQQSLEVARRTEGVRDIRDELEVRPDTDRDARPTEPAPRVEPPGTGDRAREAGEQIEDGWVTTKIQAKYFLDRDLKGRDIDVTTSNGVVTLSGTVPSEEARQQALAIARETDGAQQVVDRLTVEPVAR